MRDIRLVYEISGSGATAHEFAGLPLPFEEPASHIWLKPAQPATPPRPV